MCIGLKRDGDMSNHVPLEFGSHQRYRVQRYKKEKQLHIWLAMYCDYMANEDCNL